MTTRMEKRGEHRSIVDQYYSVEFSVPDANFIYQFKIRDLSSNGICVVVRDDSHLLKHLKVGLMTNMKYYPTDSSSPTVHLKTGIRHITKQEQGRFKGHVLVGLSILEKRESNYISRTRT